MLRFLLYMHAALGNALRLGDRLDDRGATAVEYGLIVTLIAVVIIVTVTNLGQPPEHGVPDTSLTPSDGPAKPVSPAESSESSAGRAGQPLATRRVTCRMLSALIALQNLVAEVLYRDDRGGTAVEYGLLAALIAAVIAGVVSVLGTRVLTMFTNLANAF